MGKWEISPTAMYVLGQVHRNNNKLTPPPHLLVWTNTSYLMFWYSNIPKSVVSKALRVGKSIGISLWDYLF